MHSILYMWTCILFALHLHFICTPCTNKQRKISIKYTVMYKSCIHSRIFFINMSGLLGFRFSGNIWQWMTCCLLSHHIYTHTESGSLHNKHIHAEQIDYIMIAKSLNVVSLEIYIYDFRFIKLSKFYTLVIKQ